MATKAQVISALRLAGFQQLRAPKYFRHRTEDLAATISGDAVIVEIPNTLSHMTIDFKDAVAWFTAAAN